jgi:hypothetical protein
MSDLGHNWNAALRNASISRVAIEAFVIVASILLAFAIDAWWDNRTQRRLERDYLQALRIELRNAQNEIGRDLAGQEDLRGRLVRFLAQGSMPPDSLRQMIRMASGVNNIAPPTAVLTDLISSGRLHLIRSADLREGLMRYQQMLEKIEVNERAHHEFVNTRFVPYLSGTMPLYGILTGADSTVLRSVSNEELTRLQRDQRFQNVMIERLARLQRGLPRVRSTRLHLDTLAMYLRNRE